MKGLSKQAQTTERDTQLLREYVQQLPGVPIIDGNFVSAVVPAGKQFVIASHGLGRQYKGGIICGVSFVVSSFVQTPDTVSVAGLDITKQFIIYLANTTGFDVTVNAWIF